MLVRSKFECLSKRGVCYSKQHQQNRLGKNTNVKILDERLLRQREEEIEAAAGRVQGRNHFFLEV